MAMLSGKTKEDAEKQYEHYKEHPLELSGDWKDTIRRYVSGLAVLWNADIDLLKHVVVVYDGKRTPLCSLFVKGAVVPLSEDGKYDGILQSWMSPNVKVEYLFG